MDKVDLYKVLDVQKNASLATIKKAHRKLVKHLHPDVKGGGDVDRFRSVDLAYKVLRDPKKRALYDETGTYNLASVQTEMQQVITAMVELYDNLLASGKAFDKRVSVVDLMQKIVADAISKMKTSIEKIEKQIILLTDLRQTISREDDGENLFTRTTNTHIERKRTDLNQLRGQIHTLGLVQEELSNYSSFSRVARAVQTIWINSGVSTNSTAS